MGHSPFRNVVRFGLFLNGGDLVSGTLNALLAIVSLAIAAVCFYMYTRVDPSSLYIALAIIFAVLMVVFGGMFLSGRINKTDDIHITE